MPISALSSLEKFFTLKYALKRVIDFDSILQCKACWFVLTAGLSVTVDGVHPQVGRAGVKQHLEGLGGCSNADGSKVGGLGNTLVGGKQREEQNKRKYNPISQLMLSSKCLYSIQKWC